MIYFQENFLQLVWKYQYFDKRQSVTTHQAELQIVKIGYHNQHEGPDFKEAHIRIGDIDHHGHVEIHRRSSDWNAHNHQRDTAYNSVILHVVWEHDTETYRADGTRIPVLELKGKVFLDVVRNYERLTSSKSQIVCSSELSKIPNILKFSMLEKSLLERFQKKSQLVLDLLKQNNQDWEETAYQWFFYSFGFKTNSTAMLKLSQSLLYKLLKKHGNQPHSQEALLFGQSGLLLPHPDGLFEPHADNDYVQQLMREYLFLQKKYKLNPAIYPSEWKFMGVRPSNYPTVRLAQIAALMAKRPNLFSTVLYDMGSRKHFSEIFDIEVNEYWHSHYHLGKRSEKKNVRKISEGTLDLLAINYVIPLWYAYGHFIDNPEWQEKCFEFLQDISAEQNHIISKFSAVSWRAHHAFDSQGMIELYNSYCKPKKCLECKIGQSLLRPSTR